MHKFKGIGNPAGERNLPKSTGKRFYNEVSEEFKALKSENKAIKPILVEEMLI